MAIAISRFVERAKMPETAERERVGELSFANCI